MENKELVHHGILGQKWGVRRYQNKDGTLTSAGKKREQAEADGTNSNNTKQRTSGKVVSKSTEHANSSKSKSLNDMSDEELRRRLDRLKLEQEYNKLLKGPEKKKLFDGRAFVSNALNTVAKELVNQFAPYVVGSLVGKMTGKNNAGDVAKAVKKVQDSAKKDKKDKE